jgi:hypothetical protein
MKSISLTYLKNYTIINRYDEHLPLQVLSMVGAISKKGEDNNQLGLGI